MQEFFTNLRAFGELILMWFQTIKKNMFYIRTFWRVKHKKKKIDND